MALCLATSLNAAKYSGHGIIPLDMSPNYAGAIVGLSSTAGNLMGFMAPYTAGIITDGQVRQNVYCLSFNLVQFGESHTLLFSFCVANHCSMAKSLSFGGCMLCGGDADIGHLWHG